MPVFHHRMRQRIHDFTGTGVHRVVASIAMAKEGTVTVDIDAVMRHRGQSDMTPLVGMSPTGQHRVVAAVDVSTEAEVSVDVDGVVRHRGQSDMTPLVGMSPSGQHRLVATIDVTITDTKFIDVSAVIRHAGVADMVDASQPPSADLVATDTATDLEAQFDASGSTDPDTPDSNLEYRYDSGDGSGWIDHNNDGGDWTSDDVITYTYGCSGTYAPVVEVRDPDGGNTDFASSSVTV